MDFLRKLWEKLNGKKLNTSSIIGLIAIFLAEVVVGIWEINPFWMSKFISTLNWAAMAGGTTGILHKIQKGEWVIKK